MNSSIKYLKDENGNRFSPVTSVESLYDIDGQLFKSKVVESVSLWEGNIAVPSYNNGNKVNITLVDNINNYTNLYFVDLNRHSIAVINNTAKDITTDREINGTFLNSTSFDQDRVYFFHFRITFNPSTKVLNIFDSILHTIKSTLNIVGENTYGGIYINNIYGVNFK